MRTFHFGKKYLDWVCRAGRSEGAETGLLDIFHPRPHRKGALARDLPKGCPWPVKPPWHHTSKAGLHGNLFHFWLSNKNGQFDFGHVKGKRVAGK